jgi:hypothetical protein
MMDVRKLPAGAKVTEPGVYDIEIERYHTQCTDGPSLSSTGIRRLLQSPAHFWKYSDLNPNRAQEPDKEAFVLGRAAHHLLLGEGEFAKHFVIQPTTAPDGRDWNGNNKTCKEWLAEQRASGRTVVTSKQVDKIRGMAGLLPWQKGMTNCGLLNTPLVAKSGALSGEIERSLFWQVGKVWLKARPDAIPGDSNDFSDLKTISPKSTEGLSDRDLERAIRERLLFVQGAMVGMGSSAVLQRVMTGFHLIFVDTGEVHAVSPVTVHEADLVRGERAVFLAVELFERCMQSGVWPGPTARQVDAHRISIASFGAEAFDKNLDLIEAELMSN